MPLTKLEFEKSWNSSADFPTYEDSEQKVRADLQYHPDAIRDYINETLIPEVEEQAEAAGKGLEEARKELEGVEQTLEEHRESIIDLSVGDPPEAVRAARVDFTAEDWTEDEGSFVLVIPQSAHRRVNGDFGFSLWDGGRTGTWNTAGASAVYDPETGDVAVTAEGAFAGHIVFYGV